MPRQATKEDVQDLKLAESMRDLINSPSWRVYEQLLQTHIDAKLNALLQPLHPRLSHAGDFVLDDGVAHVLVGEGAKGAIMGLRLALSLPTSIVAGAEQIRKSLDPKSAEVSP